MNAASDYLRELGKQRLDSTELDRFLSYVAAEPEKDARQRAVDHLLRLVDLTPDQVMHVAASDPVRKGVGLQLSVRRYVTSRQFEEAQRSAENEAAWKKALMLLGTAIPPC
jgi:hypothetical protein